MQTLQLQLHLTPPHSSAECTVMLGAIDKDALGAQKNYGEQEIDISNSLRSKYEGHWLELWEERQVGIMVEIKLDIRATRQQGKDTSVKVMI